MLEARKQTGQYRLLAGEEDHNGPSLSVPGLRKNIIGGEMNEQRELKPIEQMSERELRDEIQVRTKEQYSTVGLLRLLVRLLRGEKK